MTLLIEHFENGLTLLGEPMPWLGSAAFTLLLRGGTSVEPADRLGMAGLSLEMAQRGAGKWNSREIVAALDFLGVDRAASVTTFFSGFSAAMLADSLLPTLDIYFSIVQQPHLPKSELVDAKQMAMQELMALEDDPAHKCLTELKKSRFGQPFGRTAYGEPAGIEATQLPDIADSIDKWFRPQGAILAVAGRFDWDTLRKHVGGAMRNWQGGELPQLPAIEVFARSKHVPYESNQTHIALAYDSVPYGHPEFYSARGLIGILSDGMSSRLFSEVREKRGLVYSISASSNSIGKKGSVLCFAGTTNDRAQETLDVTQQTILDLAKGIEEQEMSRLRTRVKTALVTEQESSISRSSQIATDWFYLGRVPAQAEVLKEIESLTEEKMLDHFRRFPPTNWTLVTLGPKALELNHGI